MSRGGEEERGFLSRWSARKRGPRSAERAVPETVAPEAAAPDAPPALTEEEAAELTDAEALARLDLPDPDSLGHGGDFSAFLRDGVPERLKRMALRRLWAVAPGGAALDGLIEYGEDYTDAAVAVDAIVDSYEVGRGLRAHVEALEAEKAEDEAESVLDASAEDMAGEEGDPDGAQPLDPPQDEAEPDAAIRVAAPPAEENRVDPVRRKPRKMAFRFENDGS